MTKDRFEALMRDDTLELTPGEMNAGWHFCNEFDGLLVRGDPKELVCGKSCYEREREGEP